MFIQYHIIASDPFERLNQRARLFLPALYFQSHWVDLTDFVEGKPILSQEMESPLVHPPHVAKYPVPVLAEVRRFVAEVSLIALYPPIRLRVAKVPVGVPHFTDEVVCV